MNKNFKIDIHTTDGFCNTLDIEIEIQSINEEEADWVIETIFNEDTGEFVDFKSLEESDKKRIEESADDLTTTYAHQAYIDKMIYFADLYERE